LRNRLHKKDGIGLNWGMMPMKAEIYANKHAHNGLDEYKNWKPSSGWLGKVLTRHNYARLAADIPEEERLKTMGIFNVQLAAWKVMSLQCRPDWLVLTTLDLPFTERMD
jgi:hypothetical protein